MAAKPGSIAGSTALRHFADYCSLFNYDFQADVSSDPLEFPAPGLPLRGRLFHVAEYLLVVLPHVQSATVSAYLSTIAAHVAKLTGRPLFRCPMLQPLLLRHGQYAPKPAKARLPINKAVCSGGCRLLPRRCYPPRLPSRVSRHVASLRVHLYLPLYFWAVRHVSL